jgi:hypothetical protein
MRVFDYEGTILRLLLSENGRISMPRAFVNTKKLRKAIRTTCLSVRASGSGQGGFFFLLLCFLAPTLLCRTLRKVNY